MPTSVMTPFERLMKIRLALRKIDRAIEDLTDATNLAYLALPSGHDAATAVDGANEKARVCKAKMEIACKRAREAMVASRG